MENYARKFLETRYAVRSNPVVVAVVVMDMEQEDVLYRNVEVERNIDLAQAANYIEVIPLERQKGGVAVGAVVKTSATDSRYEIGNMVLCIRPVVYTHPHL